MHLGGVRTVLYNYLFARHHNGDFILRIEDTDQSRFVPGAEEYIFETLKWCGLQPDESAVHGGTYGPYRQSERKHLYKKYAEELVQKGWAYYAFEICFAQCIRTSSSGGLYMQKHRMYNQRACK